MHIGVPALRILAVAYLLSIPGLIYQAALQGLSLGKESMYISMTRQAILPLVFAFLLKWIWKSESDLGYLSFWLSSAASRLQHAALEAERGKADSVLSIELISKKAVSCERAAFLHTIK